MRLLLVLCFAVAASPALSGAWLKDKGKGFASTGVSVTARGTEARGYLEYGLSHRMTAGVSVTATDTGNTDVLAFLRLPFGKSKGPNRFAVEMAAGASRKAGQWEPQTRMTFSYGRGFETPGGNYGWLAIDAAVEQRSGSPEPLFKLDATIGQSTGSRIRPILQLETTTSRLGGTEWTIAPGVTIDGRKRNQRWVLGLERNSDPAEKWGARFSLWLNF